MRIGENDSQLSVSIKTNASALYQLGGWTCTVVSLLQHSQILEQECGKKDWGKKPRGIKQGPGTFQFGVGTGGGGIEKLLLAHCKQINMFFRDYIFVGKNYFQFF